MTKPNSENSDTKASNLTEVTKSNTAVAKVEVGYAEVDQILLDTKVAVDGEKNISVFEAVKLYPKEVFWSCVFSLGIVMAGYDGQLISSFFALPAFIDNYSEDGSGIPAPWQTGLTMGSPIGQALSLSLAYPLEWYGRKKTYAALCVLCIGFVFWQFFAPSLAVLTSGEVVAGFAWGGMVLIGPTYASEISQIKLRGILTSMNNMAFVIGQFIANGLADAYSTNTTKWAYKVPFAIQWVWPIIILVLLPFAPESPYWLVRKGKIDRARQSIRQISPSNAADDEIEGRLNVVIQTNALEEEMSVNSSYMDIFRGSNWRRTEICTVVYSIQVFSGVPFVMNYSTYFFELAGLGTSKAFDLSLGSTAIGFTATCCCWFVLSYVGRRPFYLGCLGFTTLVLFIIAFVDLGKDYYQHSGFGYGQASLMLVWSFVYQLSLGPLCFVFIGEVPSTKLKSKTIAFSTAIQACFFIVATVAMPYMLNPENGDLRGKCGFVFGGFSVMALAWAYFRLPETGGRSYEELDVMFDRNVPSRHFSKYEIYDTDNVTGIVSIKSNEKGVV